jgi:multidrug resistance protein MdtO
MGLSVMLWVVPAAGGVGDLAWIVFTGAFLGAWIAGGDKHISYAGFQIAFAYFLCVIQGPSPSFDMVVARDRVIGILLGNVVSWFVATRVWPVSVGPRIDMALRSVEHRLGGIGETIDKWSRRRLVAEVHSVLQEITSDIHLAAYEPAWVRPECAWLDARRDAVQAVQELKPPLLAIAELAPEPVNLQFGDLLNITKSANKNSSVNESPLDDSLMPLGQLLRSRIEAFQSAMSQLDRVEEHG